MKMGVLHDSGHGWRGQVGKTHHHEEQMSRQADNLELSNKMFWHGASLLTRHACSHVMMCADTKQQ